MRRFLTFLGVMAIAGLSIHIMRARAGTPWTPAEQGIETRSFTWHGAQIKAFRTLPNRVQIGHGLYEEAPGWLKKTGARVAINGGYFDGTGHSMGLRVSQGQRVSALRSADWGVFWIKNGQAHLSHTRDFKMQLKPEEAVQCGPRLVVNGKTTDLKPQWARRTGLGIDHSGRVVLAISDGELSLDQWAEAFASPSGLGCRDALNLDGGPSTQIAYKTGEAHGNVSGGWPVPDAVLIK